MKIKYTKETLIQKIKDLDRRAPKLSETELDNILNHAYSEMSAVTQAFSNEEVVPLDAYTDVGEQKFILDIEEDVTAIYDIYLSVPDQDDTVYDHGIKKIRDINVIYEDNRYNGRVHIDLTRLNGTETPSNAILKYYFTPTITTEAVYMDQQTYLSFQYAIGLATYDALHDVARSEQKRAGLNRTLKAVIPGLPEDSFDPGKYSQYNSLGI